MLLKFSSKHNLYLCCKLNHNSGIWIDLFYIGFFALIVAAVMKWDAAATEAQIKSAASDHLKHAPGRVGGGGYK